MSHTLYLASSGNLLLCTLLLGNVSVNALLSILMANLTSGLVGFFVSTFVIVLFGEIMPQAMCSRHALKVGAMSIPLVKVIILIMYPVAKPVRFVIRTRQPTSPEQMSRN